jgi:hypothetical protein
MTTSGTNTFNLTRNQIIDLALTDISVKTFFRASTESEIQQATLYLNSMIKSWKNRGLNLWKSAQGTLFLNVGQSAYKLDGTTAYATENYSSSQVDIAAISGASSIHVLDSTGFVAGYFIFINQDDNTSLSTTISSVVGNTINLSSPLTAAVSIDNYVYAFQTKIKRPEGISNLRLKLSPNDQGVEVVSVIDSNDTYYSIPVKKSPGISNMFYYNKQLDYGVINLWLVPNVNSYFVNFTFQKQFDDFDSATDTPDFPPEWLKALRLGLAYELCRAYGKEPDETLKRDAEQALMEAEGYDREDVTVRIEPASMSNIYTYR